MTTFTLYHNPRCSKSREALALLEARHVAVTVHRYLDDPLDITHLRSLAQRLEDGVPALVRTNEAQWKALALQDPSDEKRLQAIADNPRLMQRPILDDGTRARIGRPPEALLDLIE
ncbi:arsenate reductase (glutaredoxin) [Chromohalobacter canadensis]|jgi:arsenate reductase|uniref:arsenate reductase (glutaredoxin) n=1 Tax=Chromohalobacter canadensis TaxID=141389 RepID=UPI0021BF7721|nr:arsenate reductase (glutaredoxin) [Chromohalobacter canadensis]MCT8469722.1 arsenate reductase (glutaredoxin) [Chromohalobacter canadensis]MCT8472443.1 arsenate reductase (glutaredoxin) [Chromohalobacter canadensis]MCT8499444.1 arsenate reductase (glutaredoxin) [Chromohalobacter canadensis]